MPSDKLNSHALFTGWGASGLLSLACPAPAPPPGTTLHLVRRLYSYCPQELFVAVAPLSSPFPPQIFTLVSARCP